MSNSSEDYTKCCVMFTRITELSLTLPKFFNDNNNTVVRSLLTVLEKVSVRR